MAAAPDCTGLCKRLGSLHNDIDLMHSVCQHKMLSISGHVLHLQVGNKYIGPIYGAAISPST